MKHTGDYELDEINMLEQECQDLEEDNKKLEEENKKLKEERDFFKEQAILWRKDYKNEYEKNRKLEDKLESLEK
jgi:hypothetical protein